MIDYEEVCDIKTIKMMRIATSHKMK